MIVITTPTGTIGSQLLGKIVDSGEPIRVIARDPARIPWRIRERVEIVEGSHGDPAVVRRAFAGVDAVFWVVPPDFHANDVMAAYVDFTGPACDAIREQGVRRVVAVSALGRGTAWASRAGVVTALHAMCDRVAATGVDFRALTLPGFMETLLLQVPAIRHSGAFFLPASGDLKMPRCASRDVATAAARLLIDPSWSGQADAPVLGPEDISFNDTARIVSEVLERPIRFQEVSLDAFRAQMKKVGASDAMADALAAMMEAKNHGLDNHEQRTPEKTSPTGLRQWCREVLAPAVLGA